MLIIIMATMMMMLKKGWKTKWVVTRLRIWMGHLSPHCPTTPVYNVRPRLWSALLWYVFIQKHTTQVGVQYQTKPYIITIPTTPIYNVRPGVQKILYQTIFLHIPAYKCTNTTIIYRTLYHNTDHPCLRVFLYKKIAKHRYLTIVDGPDLDLELLGTASHQAK